MAYNPDIHHRRTIRLRDYDYYNGGAYFVTLCAFQRECLFGEVADEKMSLNDAGRLVTAIWDSLPQRYQGLEVDAFVVMPNHFHGIIIMNDSVGAIRETWAIRESPLQGRRRMLLSKVVGYLKMNAAKGINQLRNNPGVSVWQRDYFERVIRDERECDGIRQYIADNPAKWAEDENHHVPPVGAIHESPGFESDMKPGRFVNRPNEDQSCPPFAPAINDRNQPRVRPKLTPPSGGCVRG